MRRGEGRVDENISPGIPRVVFVLFAQYASRLISWLNNKRKKAIKPNILFGHTLFAMSTINYIHLIKPHSNYHLKLNVLTPVPQAPGTWTQPLMYCRWCRKWRAGWPKAETGRRSGNCGGRCTSPSTGNGGRTSPRSCRIPEFTTTATLSVLWELF